MGLEICCLCRIKTGSCVAGTDERFLSLPTWCGNCLGLAILVDPSVPDDGADGIAITNRGIESLEDNSCRALSTPVTVCAAVERV